MLLISYFLLMFLMVFGQSDFFVDGGISHHNWFFPQAVEQLEAAAKQFLEAWWKNYWASEDWRILDEM